MGVKRRLGISIFLLACQPAEPPAGGETGSGETGDDQGETSNPWAEADFPPVCDPWMQDCPTGEKCVPYSQSGGNWDSNKCVPITGDGSTGDPCTWGGVVEATDDCDATHVCWNVGEVDGELVGTCQPFCTGSPDDPMCPDDWYCKIYSEGSRTVCEPRCDPLAQDCADGLGCYFDANAFVCVWQTQDLGLGQPCGFVNDCAPGLTCLSADELPSCAGAACCTSFCDLGLGDAGCEGQPGTVCTAIFEPGEAPAGQEHVGWCAAP